MSLPVLPHAKPLWDNSLFCLHSTSPCLLPSHALSLGCSFFLYLAKINSPFKGKLVKYEDYSFLRKRFQVTLQVLTSVFLCTSRTTHQAKVLRSIGQTIWRQEWRFIPSGNVTQGLLYLTTVCNPESEIIKVLNNLLRDWSYSFFTGIKETCISFYFNGHLNSSSQEGSSSIFSSISHLETSPPGPVRWTGLALTCFSNAKHTLGWESEWWAAWPARGRGPQPRLHLKNRNRRRC